MKNFTILYVEDENGIRESLTLFLEVFSDNVITAEDGLQGLNLYLEHDIDLVISDIRMPNMTGLEMVDKIKRIDPEQHIIFTTAFSDSGYMCEAIDLQVDGYILKPIDFDKIESIIEGIIKLKRLKEELSVHKIVNSQINALDTMLAVLSDKQDILNVNSEFLSFFNIKNIEEFYFKYEFFHSIFIKEDACFYPRKNQSWVVDFLKTKSNKRRFVALFDESNNKPQLAIAHITYVENSPNVNVVFRKVDSLDYFDDKNNTDIAHQYMNDTDKKDVKKLLKQQIKDNDSLGVGIIHITIDSEDVELLEETALKISQNIRYTDLLKIYDINHFSCILLDIDSCNIDEVKTRLEGDILSKTIKGKIENIKIADEQDIDNLF